MASGPKDTSLVAQPAPKPPDALAVIFNERHLIRGEDPAAYDALLDYVAKTIRPQDVVEWIWLKDIVDNAWEANRYRRLRAKLFEATRKQAIQRIVESFTD